MASVGPISCKISFLARGYFFLPLEGLVSGSGSFCLTLPLVIHKNGLVFTLCSEKTKMVEAIVGNLEIPDHDGKRIAVTSF